ncbi:MAG: DUF2937 family protein, partial [Proteobacteria bacterium]|nr:DUF2937 family protein [Pseudomonadota bacterium]
MQLLKQLFDKIFFTLGVIVFLQLPHFIDQYTQRIGGYAESKQQQLADYQTIANNNFNGELALLIEGFKNSNELAVRQTGEQISETEIDVQELNTEIKSLEKDGLFDKIVFLSTHLRLDIASST